MLQNEHVYVLTVITKMIMVIILILIVKKWVKIFMLLEI